MRTSRRNPVLLIPGKGETKQQALDKLLDYWKQKDRRHGNRRSTPLADLYWIKVLTSNNYQHDLNNGKLRGWKKALLKYNGSAFIPKDMLSEIKEFFKSSFNLRFEIKPIAFYTSGTFEYLCSFPDIRTLGLMAKNQRK